MINHLKKLQWKLILSASIGLCVFNLLFISLAVSGVVIYTIVTTQEQPNTDTINQFANEMGDYSFLVLLVGMFLLPFFLRKRFDSAPFLNGGMLGLFVGLIGGLIGLQFTEGTMAQLFFTAIQYMGIGVMATLITKLITDQPNRLGMISKEMKSADTPLDIVQIIGRNLDTAHVALWHVEDHSKPIALYGSSMELNLPTTRQTKVKTHKGITVMPLTDSNDNLSTYLIVGDGNKRTWTRPNRQMYESIADQASLAYQKTILISQAKELGIIEERERLARDMHDGLGHSLSGIHMNLEAIQRMYKKSPEKADAQMELLKQLTRDTISSLQRSISGLRDSGLDKKPLLIGLNDLCDEFEQRTGCMVNRPTSLPNHIGTALAETMWRIAQEGLTNIEKHANATVVDLGIQQSENRLQLIVQDNGVGIQPYDQNKPFHYGIKGMQERASEMGGTVTVSPVTTGGTRIEAEFPYYGA